MSDVEEIERLQHGWMRGWLDGDLEACERILAPEFRLRSVATDTVIDREAWLQQAASGRIAGTEFVYEDLQVSVMGDTAVSMSRTRQEAMIDGRNWNATLNVTDVWVRRDGAWRVVARHASPLVGHAGPQTASSAD